MIPFARPSPPRLSEAADELRLIERSAVVSNFGPVNTRFEQALGDALFGGIGACLTVCNATLGLIIAIREATLSAPPDRVFALMPSFTFAAAAQAAIWCGLTPLFCDIDSESWAADSKAESHLIAQHRDRIAVVIPYATFGYGIDLTRYERLLHQHGIPTVVDAAASLGTRNGLGQGFGTGFSGSVVFSMHATKPFSTGEGGVIYSADVKRIATLRAMSNFGFGAPHSATLPGLNAKLSEVAALLAERRLGDFAAVVNRRSTLVERYRALLPGLTFQPRLSGEQAHQFVPALLPRGMALIRPPLIGRMQARGIGVGHYFSPHAREQSFLRENSRSGPLDVTEDVASRVISLPLYDDMALEEVDEVASALFAELHALCPDELVGIYAPWPAKQLAPDTLLQVADAAPAEPIAMQS